MSNHTHKLEYPIDWGKGEDKDRVTEVEFFRPKGKHLKRMPAEPAMKDLMILASKVSVKAYPPAFFDELDSVDVVAIVEVMGDFLSSGQGTGLN